MKFFSKVKLFSKVVGSSFYDIFIGLSRVDKYFDKPGFAFGGQISEITVQEDRNRGEVSTTVKAYMEIFHQGDGTLSLINPKYFEQSQVKYFALTKEDCIGGYNKIHSSHYPKTSFVNKEVERLEENLKSNKIPEDLVVTLKSSEKIGWEETIHFEFDGAKNLEVAAKKKKPIWQGFSWKDLRDKGDKFWFQFNYYLPQAFQDLKPDLMEILPIDWRIAGQIPIARYKMKDFSANIMSFQTEPLFIDFSQAKMKRSKDNAGK